MKPKEYRCTTCVYCKFLFIEEPCNSCKHGYIACDSIAPDNFKEGAPKGDCREPLIFQQCGTWDDFDLCKFYRPGPDGEECVFLNDHDLQDSGELYRLCLFDGKVQE